MFTSNVIQITSILGGAFKEQSAAGFAIFKFMQSFSCAIAFFYSRYNWMVIGHVMVIILIFCDLRYLTLQWQLLITVILDVAGTVTFCLVEWEARL